MATAQELCEAQVAVFRQAGLGSKVCSFGKPNAKNPDVVFTGCPACSAKATAGVTVEQQADGARAFLNGMKVHTPSRGVGQ